MAKNAYNAQRAQAEWIRLGIVTHGVAEDETHEAYKDIRRVVGLQDSEQVEILGEAMPIAVVMGGKSTTTG